MNGHYCLFFFPPFFTIMVFFPFMFPDGRYHRYNICFSSFQILHRKHDFICQYHYTIIITINQCSFVPKNCFSAHSLLYMISIPTYRQVMICFASNKKQLPVHKQLYVYVCCFFDGIVAFPRHSAHHLEAISYIRRSVFSQPRQGSVMDLP